MIASALSGWRAGRERRVPGGTVSTGMQDCFNQNFLSGKLWGLRAHFA